MPHSVRSCVRAAAVIAPGSKRVRSTPLPSRRTLRAGMCSVSTRVSTSSGFWTSSTSPNAAAMRSAAYTGIRRCQRSVGCAHRPCWVLTTSGVRVRRRGDAAEDAGLRVVGVDDVGAQRVEQPQELAERAQVVERVVRAGEGGHVDVADAHGVEVGDVGPGRRHADDLVAGAGEGLQLRSEQPVEAHVGGGDVDDSRLAASHAAADQRSTCHRSAPR